MSYRAIVEQIAPDKGLVRWWGNRNDYLTRRFPKIAALKNGCPVLAIEVTPQDITRIWESPDSIVVGEGKPIGFCQNGTTFPRVNAVPEEMCLKLTLALVE